MKILLFVVFVLVLSVQEHRLVLLTSRALVTVWGIWAKISHSGDHLHVLVKSLSVALESYGFIHDM